MFSNKSPKLNAQNLYCPQCHTLIPIEDLNVSTDIALCRHCQRMHKLSEITVACGYSAEDLLTTPANLKRRETMAGSLVFEYQKVNWAPLLFLVPFTAFWGGFSVWGIYIKPLLQGRVQWLSMVWGLPFLLGSIGLVTAILLLLFGKWTIELRAGRGKVVFGLWKLARARYFDLTKDSSVELKSAGVVVNGKPKDSITITTAGKVFSFGSTIEDAAKRHIAATLAQQRGRR